MIGVLARVKAGNQSMEEFTQLVNRPDFNEQLSRAIADPSSSEAAILSETLQKLVRLTGGTVPWGPVERAQTLSQFFGLIHYCGVPNWFITISPADLDSVLMLRLSHACGEEEFNLPIDLPDALQRSTILSANPVAAAQVYIRLIESLFSELLGLPAEHQTRKSPPSLHSRPVGVLGRMTAFAGVTEAQGRGTLHLHFLAWPDLQPSTMREFVNDEEVMTAICGRLDSLVQAWIPEISEVNHSDQPAAEVTMEDTRDGRRISPLPNVDPSAFKKRFVSVVQQTNVHVHKPTCHKGKAGKVRCRMGMPQHTCDMTTGLRELRTVLRCGKEVIRALRHVSDSPPPLSQPIDSLRNHDRRTISIDLFRPQPNNNWILHHIVYNVVES